MPVVITSYLGKMADAKDTGAPLKTLQKQMNKSNFMKFYAEDLQCIAESSIQVNIKFLSIIGDLVAT